MREKHPVSKFLPNHGSIGKLGGRHSKRIAVGAVSRSQGDFSRKTSANDGESESPAPDSLFRNREEAKISPAGELPSPRHSSSEEDDDPTMISMIKKFPGGKANSTSTMFVKSTISVPDSDEITMCVVTVVKCHIDAPDVTGPAAKRFKKNPLRHFNEDRYFSRGHREKLVPKPTVEDIYKCTKTIFEVAQFSPECNIIALIYINRVLTQTGIPLCGRNWRLLLLIALLLAQKVWDDRCLTNVDFPVIWRAAVGRQPHARPITLPDINMLEKEFLILLQYSVCVNASLYTKYYFELRSLCRTNDCNLNMHPLTPAEAKRLEVCSLNLQKSFSLETQSKDLEGVLYESEKTRNQAILS